MVQRLKRYSAALLLVLTPLGTLLLPGVAHAAANTCLWTGATDTLFSTATNWSNCGGVAPLAGDIISFGVLGSGITTYTLTNDLGVALGGVTYGDGSVDATNNPVYELDTLSLADGAVITGVNAQGASSPNVDVHTAAMTAAGSLTFNNGSIGVSASASGQIVVTPTTLTTNTYTNYSGGVAYIQYHPSGAVTVGNGGDYVAAGTESAITVQNGGRLETSGATFSVPVTYGGGGGTANPVLADGGVSVTVSGAQVLQHNVDVDATNTVTITGPLSGAFTITKATGATGTLVINSANNTSNTPNGTTATPDTTTTLSDSQPATNVTVANHSTTIIDGARARVDVNSGGTLKGTGTVGALFVTAGATLAPGHSPGCMNSGNLTENGTYQVEIGGTDPCAGYDQMKVTGTVDVTGGTLSVSRYNNFKPASGQSYTIIDNDGSDAVTGTFTGLAEGATLKLDNGTVLAISYTGGDGNDVVLTVQNVPATPDTGFGIIAAHPIVTLAITAAAAGMLVVLARRVRLAPARAKVTRR